jgi:dTDP-4-dehydrorhamnose reductase
LTTARFSGLYGHWYPHGRDDQTFVRALLGQCRATALAMHAIREINPHAQLIQTEDLGKIFSTRALRYQAEFENERRWLSLDLLCGRVTSEHRMWPYLTGVAGIDESELAWFIEHPCPPDIIGINHYLTSERFLDERIERYPTACPAATGSIVMSMSKRCASVPKARRGRACCCGKPGSVTKFRWRSQKYI